ncbi:uncharacterized protein [Euphorbia lathyris]|uniref:uncharacterized protein isoform X6 n=1 Tax=Euphorbia lathyris TaxID=212925 RepID=UPI00331419D9
MHVLKNGEILRSVPLIFLREAPIVKQIVGEWSNQLQLSRFPAMQIQPSLCLRTILVTQQYMRQLGRRELSRRRTRSVGKEMQRKITQASQD